MQSDLVLGYWKIRGRAQPIRLLLEYLGVRYTEKRYSDASEWFEKDKLNLNLEFPNLPYLIDGSKKFTETFAIIRYLCLRCNRRDLLGTTDDQDVKTTMLQGVLVDLINDTFSLCCDSTFTKIKDPFFKDKLSPRLASFSKYIGRNDFLIGSLSYLDFVLFELLDMLNSIDNGWLDSFPNLISLHKRMKQIPEIRAYMASSNYIEAPFLLPELAVWTGL